MRLNIIKSTEVPLNSLYYLPHGSFFRDKEGTKQLELGIYINPADTRTEEEIYSLLNYKTVDGKSIEDRMGYEKGKAIRN